MLLSAVQLDYRGEITRRDYLGDCRFNLAKYIVETKRDLRAAAAASPEWELLPAPQIGQSSFFLAVVGRRLLIHPCADEHGRV